MEYESLNKKAENVNKASVNKSLAKQNYSLRKKSLKKLLIFNSAFGFTEFFNNFIEGLFRDLVKITMVIFAFIGVAMLVKLIICWKVSRE